MKRMLERSFVRTGKRRKGPVGFNELEIDRVTTDLERMVLIKLFGADSCFFFSSVASVPALWSAEWPSLALAPMMAAKIPRRFASDLDAPPICALAST
jgi:hypothetical protein